MNCIWMTVSGMKEEKRERTEEKPVFPGKNMKKS